MKRILLIQTAFLGDVVFSTALLRGLKKLYEASEITVVASPRGADVLREHPAVSEVVVYDKRGRERGPGALVLLARRLRRRRFDLVVCPHRSLRSAVITRWAGAPVRLGFRSGWGLLSFNAGPPFPSSEKRPYRRECLLLEALSPGASLDCRPWLTVSEGARREIRRILADKGLAPGVPVAGLVPGTVWPTKKWPRELFLEAGRGLLSRGIGVVVIGGPAERKEGPAFPEEEGFVDLTGVTSLALLPALLAACKVVVAADTGPLHAAMALGVPVVALFGPTDERQFEFGPGDICLTADLECRPCSPHGGLRCPEGDWRCLPGISSALVERSVTRILEQQK